MRLRYCFSDGVSGSVHNFHVYDLAEVTHEPLILDHNIFYVVALVSGSIFRIHDDFTPMTPQSRSIDWCFQCKFNAKVCDIYRLFKYIV